jgi:general secretion pathway protein G
MVKLILWTTAIVAVLLAVSGDRIAPRQETRIAVSSAQVNNFLTALDVYRSDVGEFPSEAEGLRALCVNPGKPGWAGPYMKVDIPLDPWGAPYEYRIVDGQPRITHRTTGR